MGKYAIQLFVILFFPGFAISQTTDQLELTSSNIVNNSTEVTTGPHEVRFQFNMALDIEVMQEYFWDFVLFSHEDDTDLESALRFSEDRTSMIFDISHEPDTDYLWIIIGAVAEDGDQMTEPYILRYTTASDLGTHTVSGHLVYDNQMNKMAGTVNTISAVNNSAFSFNDNIPVFDLQNSNGDALRRTLEEHMHSVLPGGSSKVKANRGSFGMPNKITNVQNSELEEIRHTLVLLVDQSFEELFLSDIDEFMDDEMEDEEVQDPEYGKLTNSTISQEDENGDEAPEIFGVSIVDPDDGTFSIPNVRSGTYFVIAIELSIYGEMEDFFPGIGYYEDNTGNQFIEVDDDVSDLEIMFYTFQPFSAQNAIQQVRSFIDSEEMDADVYYVMTFVETDPQNDQAVSGRSDMWFVLIYDSSGGEGEEQVLATIVMPQPFGVLGMFPMDEEDIEGIDLSAMKAIPTEFIDSDAALSVAESNGGSAFRANLAGQSNAWFWMDIEGGHNFWEYPFAEEGTDPADIPLHWTIYYSGEWYNAESEEWGQEELAVYVDMTTGEFINKTVTSVDEPDMQTPGAFHLEQNFPNPFNPATRIRYQLPGKNEVTLEVFDLMGRKVATLVNETQDAGTHVVSFEGSGLSSGLYIYILRAGTLVETRKMTLIK